MDKSAPRIPEDKLQMNLKERPINRVKHFLKEVGDSEIYSTPQKLHHRRNSPVAVSDATNGFSNTYYLLNIASPKTKAYPHLHRQYSSKSDLRGPHGLDAIIHNTRPITRNRSPGSEKRFSRHSLPTTLINEIQQLRQIND